MILPNSLQELLNFYVGDEINFISDHSIDSQADFRDLREWVESFAPEHGLRAPNVDYWDDYIFEEE